MGRRANHQCEEKMKSYLQITNGEFAADLLKQAHFGRSNSSNNNKKRKEKQLKNHLQFSPFNQKMVVSVHSTFPYFLFLMVLENWNFFSKSGSVTLSDTRRLRLGLEVEESRWNSLKSGLGDQFSSSDSTPVTIQTKKTLSDRTTRKLYLNKLTESRGL